MIQVSKSPGGRPGFGWICFQGGLTEATWFYKTFTLWFNLICFNIRTNLPGGFIIELLESILILKHIKANDGNPYQSMRIYRGMTRFWRLLNRVRSYLRSKAPMFGSFLAAESFPFWGTHWLDQRTNGEMFLSVETSGKTAVARNYVLPLPMLASFLISFWWCYF